MAYYDTCPNCGCNLDPGEKCTCTEDKARQQDFFSRYIKISKSGQLAFVFDDKSTQGGRDIG